MSSSPFSLPPVKTKRSVAAEAAMAVTRQLQAIEADIQAGRLQEAAGALNQLRETHAQDARLYVTGWLLANKGGNAPAALQSSLRAAALAPMSPIAHYCVAESRRAVGEFAAASESIEQALVLASDNLQYRELAVNLANAQGDFAAAERHLRLAYTQNAKIPGIKTMIGNGLRYQSKFDEAHQWLSEAVAANPDDADAQHGLAMVAFQRGQSDVAATHLNHALRVHPNDEGYLFLRSVFAGETPIRQPESMIRAAFDQYAIRFDSHVVGTLNYGVPPLIAQAIVAQYPSRKLDILDLGCGTGLLGAALGPVEGFFVGVDHSPPMIEEARRHNVQGKPVYARFHQVDLCDALQATDANEYDVIVAADVFGFVGALEAPLRDALKVLRPGGSLFFTCEQAGEDGPDLVINKHLRYGHKRSHVEGLLRNLSYDNLSVQELALRTEPDGVVHGFLMSARKPSAV